MCLEDWRIRVPVGSLFYVPEVIDDALADGMVSYLIQRDASFRRTALRSINVIDWKKSHMDESARVVPDPLQCILSHLAELRLCNVDGWPIASELGEIPNNCLVNKYEVGEGIDPHSDGPMNARRVMILTLQSGALMTFYHNDRPGGGVGAGFGAPKDASQLFSIYLQPKSLLIFSDELYDHFHCIPSTSRDIVPADCVNCATAGVNVGAELPRGPLPRFSLTLRHVQ